MAGVRLGVIQGTGRLYAGPTLVGVGRGYFAKQGLDIEVRQVEGRAGITMLASGELDVAPLGPGFYFFHDWTPERPMVMVADQGQMRPGRGSGAIVARPALVESGALRDFPDLRGKRIGISRDRGDHDWLTFAAALRRGGLTFDDVELVTTDFGDARHEALADGTIDVSTVGRLSSIMAGRDAGAFVAWKHEYEVQPGRQQFAVMFSHRFRSEQPVDAAHYVLAYLQGARDYYAAFEQGINRDAIVDVLAVQAGYPREAVANEMVPTGVDPNGQLNTKSIAADLAWLQEQQLVASTVTMDHVVDGRYLDAALAELGPYR
jgi:NitT/TauT family transport system substrate-binding protein